MASKGQLTGMTGAFLVAAQLSNRKMVASTTSRGAAGADILVTDTECQITFSIQVKTNSKKASFWLLSGKQPPKGSDSHIYAFVNLGIDASGDVIGDYYLVPSRVVRRIATHGGDKWPVYSVAKSKIEKYHNAWTIFDGS
ncbi:MAG: hypothetical protein ACRDHZ_16735 [Ktedonobacteraceae bacterium]